MSLCLVDVLQLQRELFFASGVPSHDPEGHGVHFDQRPRAYGSALFRFFLGHDCHHLDC